MDGKLLKTRSKRVTAKYSRVRIGELLGGLLVLLLFILAGYVNQNYGEYIRDTIGTGGVSSFILYIALTITAVVIAPIGTLPLLPIAVGLWGTVTAALLSIFGWTVGAIIAYVLAKKYGRPLVGKVTNLQRVQYIGVLALGKQPFWSVVLLRMVVPVDILSYALGLFIDMPVRTYAVATLIGITPFAFVFAYAASLPVLYQIAVLAVAAVVVLRSFMRIRRAVGKHDAEESAP